MPEDFYLRCTVCAKRVSSVPFTGDSIVRAYVECPECVSKVKESTKKKIYYAHCVATYDTAGEGFDIQLLKDMGFDVVNPNTPEYKDRSKLIMSRGGTLSDVMKYFTEIVKRCDGLAFRALPENNSISAGVHKEIMTMMAHGGFIIELPNLPENRKVLSVNETREYIKSKKN